MKTLQAEIPELLLQEVAELAAKQKTTVDQIVSLALAAQVSAWRTRDSIAARANRVDWHKVDEILARVPNNPPLSGDET
jgi:hypothetical protein